VEEIPFYDNEHMIKWEMTIQVLVNVVLDNGSSLISPGKDYPSILAKNNLDTKAIDHLIFILGRKKKFKLLKPYFAGF
jgi:hypothetical protein